MLNGHLDRANSGEVEKRLGYTFKNRFLMLQALTHGSYSSNTITSSYESLEVKPNIPCWQNNQELKWSWHSSSFLVML
jgi:hypothetical protein